jgi:hypothetical protein
MSSDTLTTLTTKQQYWLDHIQQAKSDNQSLSAYAQQHALDLKAMYHYHWLLRKRGFIDSLKKPSPFIKVTRPANAKAPTSLSVVTLLFPNGIRLEVPAADLLTLLQQVQSL